MGCLNGFDTPFTLHTGTFHTGTLYTFTLHSGDWAVTTLAAAWCASAVAARDHSKFHSRRISRRILSP